MKSLQGKVAVVAGATRGAGRGIACALGEAGATVYCSGRSVRGNPASGNRPETIEETAEMVTAHGGVGIHARTDHTVEEDVRALFDRVKTEQGRLDILVNDVWGGDVLTEFGKTFWQVSLDKGKQMLEQAVVSHIITSRYATPLIIETGPGLIVEITDGDSFTYRGNIFYDLVKTSVIRLAFAMARELRSRRITSIAVTPGFLRSEMMLENFGVTEENWREGAKKDANFIVSESPFYVGRAVVAVASDPDMFSKTGRVFSSWDLAAEYGFTDLDGSRPMWSNHFEEKYGKRVKKCDEAFYDYWFDSPDPIEIVFPDWP
jgi:NAD(P)-dependent dehydrogenase (short-subunit alcohol dehydrogenase family)